MQSVYEPRVCAVQVSQFVGVYLPLSIKYVSQGSGRSIESVFLGFDLNPFLGRRELIADRQQFIVFGAVFFPNSRPLCINKCINCLFVGSYY